MTSRFKSIMRAERRGHVRFGTQRKGGRLYITSVERRAKAHRSPMTSSHVRLNNGDVERFIPYGQ